MRGPEPGCKIRIDHDVSLRQPLVLVPFHGVRVEVRVRTGPLRKGLKMPTVACTMWMITSGSTEKLVRGALSRSGG